MVSNAVFQQLLVKPKRSFDDAGLAALSLYMPANSAQMTNE
jgi:hypothetical protein